MYIHLCRFIDSASPKKSEQKNKCRDKKFYILCFNMFHCLCVKKLESANNKNGKNVLAEKE